MSMEDGRHDKRRVVTGRDRTGSKKHLVLQEIDGQVALKTVGPDPVYLDPQAVSKTIRYMRDLQACAMRGIQWEI